MGYDQFMKEEHRMALQEMIGELTGKQVDIACQSKESLKETNLGNINLSKVHFDIKIEN